MPDDDRTRRRLGDETKNRIADLASGWSVDSPRSEPPPAPEPARKKPRTNPPPPPGSPERRALEHKIVATTDAKDDPTDQQPAPARAKAQTGSQPVVDRSKPVTTPPPPPGARSATGPQAVVRSTTGSQPVVDRSKPIATPPPPPGAIPPALTTFASRLVKPKTSRANSDNSQ